MKDGLDNTLNAIAENWPQETRTFAQSCAFDRIREGDSSEQAILDFLVLTDDWNDDTARALKRELKDYLYAHPEDEHKAA